MTVAASKAKADPADALAADNDTSQDDESVQHWQVRSRDGRRVFFEGTEDDAGDYVERNFPHAHAEPNTHYPDGIEPDVYVHGPDGSKHGFVGGEWTTYDDTDNDD